MTDDAIRLADAVVRAIYRKQPVVEDSTERRGSLLRVV
jgi:hypothetical protein